MPAAAAPPPIHQQWWVEQNPLGQKISPYRIVESPTRPPNTQQWIVAAGPFATQADAQKWVTQHQGHFPHIPNPFGFLAWIQDVGHWIGVFVANITDIHMWISLGWLLLGGFLLLIGLWLWARGTRFYQEFQKQATQAATVAAAA